MLSNLPMITQLVRARAKTPTLVYALKHNAVLWKGRFINLFEILCKFSITNYYIE